MKPPFAPLAIVRRKTSAAAIAPMIPARYRPNSTSPCNPIPGPTLRGGMKAAMMTAYTGNRAEQVISGAIRIVVSRSLGSSIVRVAMMPGIAQAKDDSRGMNARPDNPTPAISRSIMKAARTM